METKQSSIEFLLTELDIPKLISREKLIMAGEVVRQAKEMHKQEIIDAIKFGQDNYSDTTIEDKEIAEQYYNETFVAQK